MDDNIEKRFENFGTLQANQSTNPPKNSDIRSSVFSIPGDGNYATMTVNNNPNERKKFTSLYPENSSDDFELKGLGERIISFSTGEARNLNVMSQNSNEKLFFHQQRRMHNARKERLFNREARLNDLVNRLHQTATSQCTDDKRHQGNCNKYLIV